jgi:hypothetical protein
VAATGWRTLEALPRSFTVFNTIVVRVLRTDSILSILSLIKHPNSAVLDKQTFRR